MEVTELPFNKFIDLRRSQRPDLGVLELDDSPNYHNHVSTVHAAAQFALAEACSGEYMLSHFAELATTHLGVVRRVETKFRNPARGKVYAKAHVPDEQTQKFVDSITARGRAFIKINVDVVDSSGVTTMNAVIEWFVQKIG